jgi:hypothetical protein
MDFSTVLDIAIGFLGANSFVHMAIGITGTRFLSPFGYGKNHNIIYSVICLTLSGVLLGYKDLALLIHPVVMGALFNYLAALLVGSILLKKWNA